ncbi:MAG: dTDP-glucose 4,6-dehydratase [Endomicrobiales bacterium]
MKLLVTGGAGFIGSNFIRYILKEHPSYEVINLDKLTYAGNLENLKDVEKSSRYTFVKGDICNAKVVNRLTPQVDAIINFAAETHVDRSILTPQSFIETDVRGTFTLLEAAKKYKIKRYIQISTDEVYGSIARGSFTEKSPLSPNSPYSSSKAGGDLLVRSYFITYNVPAIITRSSNNFGPSQYPEKIIPLFITNALENKPLPLYGDGKNVRDWLYVVDNCRAIDAVLHRGREGEVYNIGGGNEITNIDLTKLILKKLGKPSSLIVRVPDRPGHDRRYSLDCSKLKKELNYCPDTDFTAALAETIDWYCSHQAWWKKLKNKEFKEYYKKQYKSKKS